MKWTVGKKINIGFFFLLTLIIVISCFTYWKIGEITSSYQEFSKVNIDVREMVQGTAADIANEGVVMRRFNFTGDPNDIPIYNDYKAKANERIHWLESNLRTENSKAYLIIVKKEKSSYEEIAEKSMAAKQANKLEDVAMYMAQAGQPYKEAMAATEAIISATKEYVRQEQEKYAQNAVHSKIILVVVNIIVIILAMIISFLVSRSVAREQALQESEARYRAIIEDQIELIRRFRPDGTLTFVNGALCNWFDKSMEELLGKNVILLIPAEEREIFKEQLFSLHVDNPVAMSERKFVKPDGEVRWQQWVNRAIFDESGKLLEFQSVGRDITAQKQIEQQLKESEARYRAVVEDQVDLIRRFLPDGTLTFVNSAFCRYFSKSMDDIIGRNFINFVPPANRDAILRLFDGLSPEHPVAMSEYKIETNNSNCWLQWNNHAIFNELGEVIEYQSVGRDITVEKEAQIRVAEAREAIERAARVTTLAIIGGGIAHEINQPLNAIRLLSETVLLHYQSKGDMPSGEVIKNVSNISQQVDRIDNIVNHLRSFLRNSQNYDYTPCNLNDIVEKALSLVGNQLISRHIQVNQYLASNLPFVYGAPIRFEEVLLNLLMNAMQALDAASSNQRKISICTWNDDEKVYLEVRDNGPGINEAMKERIFEPFFSTKSGDSMGLGLSIIQSIVIASNGSISVGNNSRGGAKIKVSFPVYAE
ncbi:PAS domain S-box protein [Sporomusa sp. KB1]|jgi:PAS domain S-box-containing protein|uniref:PAS domain S-box protein n=1 Tax=Sporomusa sp. KB1 TaxID=943346 RepID=UPI00119D588E|nr:PAS domain S-box protein [Sporomusa sp. KB1]TWH46510.1 PAS domain S-box-containing protein [Sporomusa sp. KB1]